MPTHTTPPPHADQTDQTAEPARRAPRFDERGIALQTVIIMVVLLAIAGGIAAVLLNRGQEASDQLASSDFGTAANEFTSPRLCRSAGHGWDESATECKRIDAFDAGTQTDQTCKAFNTRWKEGTGPDADNCVVDS